jgi:hypothetical protein
MTTGPTKRNKIGENWRFNNGLMQGIEGGTAVQEQQYIKAFAIHGLEPSGVSERSAIGQIVARMRCCGLSYNEETTRAVEFRFASIHRPPSHTTQAINALTISILVKQTEGFLEFGNLFFGQLVRHGICCFVGLWWWLTDGRFWRLAGNGSHFLGVVPVLMTARAFPH